MKGRASNNLLGSLFMGPLMTVCGVAFVVGAFHMHRDSVHETQEARELTALPPQTLVEIASLRSGHRVLVSAHVDPAAPILQPNRGLALYIRQYYRHRTSQDQDEPYGWTDAEWIRPPFRIRGEGGSVDVLNSDYEILQPPYADPEQQGLTSLYRGFRPGDRVLVDGIAERGGILATAVTGHERTAYIELRRAQADGAATAAIVFGPIGALMIVGGLLITRHYWRTHFGARP